MTAPADTPPAPLDEVLEPGAGGYPDEAQPCQLGGSHPATHSILFRDEDAYAPSCDDHDAEIRETLIEAGETIVGEVPIVAAIADDPVTAAAVEVLDGQPSELTVRFPVIAVEGLDTADGRLITADALTARPTPLTVLCQTRAAHGGQPPPAAWTVGRIDTLERVPGPDVISAMTGEPFPDGTWVWRGTGTIDPAALVEGRPIGELLARRFVRGISADLVPSDFEVFGDGDPSTLNPDEPTRRAIVHKAELGGLTIIPIPAFGDCTVELDDAPPENMPADMPAADPTELGLAASAFPAWRSAEVGDYPALVAAGEQHTGGMIALVPANADELLVDGGLPAEELHLTLAYLGDDVTGWPAARRASLIEAMRVHAEREPITARVMAHAQFNPDGGPDGDRDPCAVYLLGDSTGLAPLRSAVMTEVGEDEDLPEQHEPPIFHITAGYGVEPSALTFTGPVVFDRLRVALGMEVTDFDLTGEQETPALAASVEAFARKVATARGVKWYQLPIGALIRRKKPGVGRNRRTSNTPRAMTDRDRAAVKKATEGFSPVRLRTVDDITDFFTAEENIPVANSRQQAAVGNYTATGHKSINAALREGRPPSAQVRAIDSTMTPTKQDLGVWRIVRPDALGMKGTAIAADMAALKGSVLTDQAYMSTSVQADIDKNTSGDAHPVRMHIAVPAGTPALLAAELSSWPAERELLLPRNTSVVITKTRRRTDGSGWDVYGVVVPTDTTTERATP